MLASTCWYGVAQLRTALKAEALHSGFRYKHAVHCSTAAKVFEELDAYGVFVSWLFSEVGTDQELGERGKP